MWVGSRLSPAAVWIASVSKRPLSAVRLSGGLVSGGGLSLPAISWSNFGPADPDGFIPFGAVATCEL